MPKIVDKSEMQDAIIDAALRVFADKGFHAATISNVAEAAGLGKGTIYIYFESKNTLATAIVDRYFLNISQQIMSKEPWDTLDAFMEELRQTMDVSAEQASFHRLFFEIFGPSFGSDEFAKTVATFFDKLGSYYAKQIAHLQAVGEVAKHHDAISTGRVFSSMLDGIILHQGLFGISAKHHEKMVYEAIKVLGLGLRRSCPTGATSVKGWQLHYIP